MTSYTVRRWKLEGLGLTYLPTRSTSKITFYIEKEKLEKVCEAAQANNPALLRDLVMGPYLSETFLKDPGMSSVLSSNTWRSALPLFGGPPPQEWIHSRKPRRKKFEGEL